MGDSTSATRLSTPTRGSVTEKVPRPILKRKGTPGHSSLLGSARVASQEVIQQEAKPDMAASFLQFCAMCEKQIMTPCNSILYCSEACRRKDSLKPLTAAIISTTTCAPASPPSSAPSSPRPVLSPRLPTGVTLTPRTSTTSIPPADLHDHSSDLDPTEWKPKLPERSHSEAFRYLSQFHRSIAGSEHNASAVTASTTPSLANTPTTTASSSLSTSASRHSYGYSYSYSNSHNPYDFNTRPLPTRPNRWYSFNSGTPKGVDLVTPHVAPSIHIDVGQSEERVASTPIDNDGMRWEKRKVMFSVPARVDDGLSVLFAETK